MEIKGAILEEKAFFEEAIHSLTTQEINTSSISEEIGKIKVF